MNLSCARYPYKSMVRIIDPNGPTSIRVNCFHKADDGHMCELIRKYDSNLDRFMGNPRYVSAIEMYRQISQNR